jgi:hypothetical protein
MRDIRSRFMIIVVSAILMSFGLDLGTAVGSPSTTHATNDPVVQPSEPQVVESQRNDITPQAWECRQGDFCVWENTGGTGRRCSWTNADPDWFSGTVVCSWADDTKVESAFNNGLSTDVLSVETFWTAGYLSFARFDCFDRGVLYNITNGGVTLQSHRWRTYTC